MTPSKPDEIMAESFRIIEEEVGSHSFDAGQWPIVRRMIHASGDLDLIPFVRFHNDPVTKGLNALASSTPIVTDVTMVLAGINHSWANQLGVPIRCFLNDEGVVEKAKQLGTTRSALAMEKAMAQLPEAIYVIGNAPTALFALCRAVKEERGRPALIVAIPVGFVAVRESKEEALRLSVPVISILGRKGGSAIAAAAVNALLQLAMENKAS